MAAEEANLPQQIIVNIISRLPLKSLLRFTAVSKRWHSIITFDKDFANEFRRKNTLMSRRLLACTQPSVYVKGALPRLESLDQTLSTVGEDLEVNFSFRPTCRRFEYKAHVKLIGSCNGLVVLSQKNVFYLFNPLTRFLKKLPRQRFSANAKLCAYGFGYTDDYKVVVCYKRVCEVFSFRHQIWRKIPNTMERYGENGWNREFVGPRGSWFSTSTGILLHGQLHWLSKLEEQYITVFHLYHEYFDAIELPPSFGQDGKDCSHLGVLGGCLCVLCYQAFDCNSKDFWVMRNRPFHQTWEKHITLRFTIPRDLWPNNCKVASLKPLLITESCTISLIYPGGDYEPIRISISHNQEGEEEPSVDILSGNWFELIEYEESLVWISKFEHLSDSEEEGLEEGDDDVDEDHENELDAPVETEAGKKLAEASSAPKDAERQLSKKELKKKGLEELEAVLAELGLGKNETSVNDESRDAGVEAKDCIKIYLVSSKEEVGASNGFCLESVDLNGLLEDDGKIYGYKGLKITVWISSISFDAYADIAFERTADGGKGITDLKSVLENIFGETLVASQEEFLQTFSTQRNFIRSIISNGEVLQHKASSTSDVEVVRMIVGKTAAGPLYSCLLPLVFLLVDGASPIDVLDPGWELYLLVEKKTDQHGDIYNILLGFTALYRFYHYPDSTRLRLSQILVLPPFQHKGYGRYILEVLSHVAVSEDVYDFTIEKPLDYLQYIRTCVDVLHLQKLDSVRDAVNLAVSNLTRGKLSKKAGIPRLMPPARVIEDVRKSLKINKKQFLRCWEVLIYLGLNPVDKYMEDFVSIIYNQMKEDIIGKESGTGGKQVVEVPSEHIPEMSFVMFKCNAGETTSTVQVDENQPNKEEALQEFVDERVNEIKSIAVRVSQNRISMVDSS